MEGKALGFDLESTGPIPTEALPVSFALIAFEDGKVGKGRTGLVNPGVPIPEEATAIHGITDEMVAKRGGDLEKTVNGIYDYLIDMQQIGAPIVGMNIRYDLTVVDTILRATTRHGLRELGWEGYCIDVLVLDRHLDKYRRGKRNLPALCKHYGVNPGQSHDAASDVVASYNVALAIAAKYPGGIGELSLEELHVVQQKAHFEWASHFTEYRLSKGEPALDQSEYGWPLPGEVPV